MKLITLIYQSKNITDSINIKLFFELAGIYVYEIQSDIKINSFWIEILKLFIFVSILEYN